MNTQQAETQYLSVNQVKSEFPFINPGTLANLRCRKEGPRYFKVGKKVLYRRSDLLAWFEAEPILTRGCVPERG
jgi:hypothetical protein